MKTSRIIILSIVSVLALSCAKEAARKEAKVVEIEACLDNSQKTSLVDGGTAVYWNPGDQISVLYGDVNLCFTSLNKKLATTTVFSSVNSVIFGFMEDASDESIIGVYPYSEDTEVDGNGDVVTALSTSQKGVPGSFDQNTCVCMGKSNSLKMNFYNLCGGLRFTLTDSQVRGISFEATGAKPVAGKFTATFQGGLPVVKSVDTPSSVISLRPAEGDCFEAGKWYYIATLPATLDNGFKMTFEHSDKCAELVSTKSVTIQRNVFGSIAEIDKGLVYDKSLGHKEDWKVEAESEGAKLIDSKIDTRWRSTSTSSPASVVIDMGHAWEVNRIILVQSSDTGTGGTAVKTLKVEGSNDKSNWTTALDSKDMVLDCFTQRYDFDKAVNARYIRLTMTGVTAGKYIQLAEVDLAGPSYTSGDGAGSYECPELINTSKPWSFDPDHDWMWSRFYSLTDWTHVNAENNRISYDKEAYRPLFFAFPQTGYNTVAQNVKNCKFFQSFTLVPGDYAFVAMCVNCDSQDGKPGSDYLKNYMVATAGETLTDMSVLLSTPSSDPNWLNSYYISDKVGDKTGAKENIMKFKVTKTGLVSVGFVYETSSPMNNYVQYYFDGFDFYPVELQ